MSTSSSILDWTGRPFARAIGNPNGRGYVRRRSNPNRGINDLIRQTDRNSLAALSRKIVWNMPIPKSGVSMKAAYSVGSAWAPQYGGMDRKRGEVAGAWLVDEWFDACDVRHGEQWWDALELVSKSLDRDGESFTLLSRRENGWPAVQHLPAHTIKHSMGEGTRQDKAGRDRVDGGPWDGALIEDGVIHTDQLTVLAYRHYYGELPNQFVDLAAGSVVHIYEREFAEQLRGYPVFASALSDLEKSLESTGLELLRQVYLSSMYIVEKGEGPDPNDPRWTGVKNPTTEEGVLVESVQPGIRSISSGSELDVITHTNPGEAWEVFQSRIERCALAVAGIPASLVCASASQGTAQRSDVVRMRHTISTRQRQLKRWARPVGSYAVAAGNEAGFVGSAPNSFLWDFSTPARLTVDDGREDKAQLEALDAGALTLTDYLANKGRSLAQHLREAALDRVAAAKIAEEISESEGIPITAADLMPHIEKPQPVPAGAAQQQAS